MTGTTRVRSSHVDSDQSVAVLPDRLLFGRVHGRLRAQAHMAQYAAAAASRAQPASRSAPCPIGQSSGSIFGGATGCHIETKTTVVFEGREWILLQRVHVLDGLPSTFESLTSGRLLHRVRVDVLLRGGVAGVGVGLRVLFRREAQRPGRAQAARL